MGRKIVKYCTHCGNPVDDQAKFCASCGSPMDTTPAAVSPAVASASSVATEDAEATKQKKILYVAIAIVAAVILVFTGLLIHDYGATSAKNAGPGAQGDVETQQAEDETESDQEEETDSSDEESSSSEDEDSTESTVTNEPSEEPTAKPSPTPTPTKKRTAEDMTTSEIRKTLQTGDFSIIAGRYCSHSDGCLIVDDDGGVRAENTSRRLTYEKTGTTLHVDDGNGLVNSWIMDKVITLEAPDDDFRCFSDEGDVELWGSACEQSSDYGAYAMFLPAWMVYYPKGVELNGDGVTGRYETYTNYTPPDTSRPFIQWLQSKMNPPVADQIVYYLVD